jgi:hypothetical protein
MNVRARRQAGGSPLGVPGRGVGSRPGDGDRIPAENHDSPDNMPGLCAG